MNYWHRHRSHFLIEKARPGRYHNSPKVWSRCGVIRARDRAEAAIEACFIVGSSNVRVIPLGGVA